MNRLFQKEEREPRSKRLNWLFGAGYLVIVLGIVVLITIAIYSTINQNCANQSILSDSTGIFAIILAGLTITLASSIIFPKVLLQYEVKSELAILKKEFKDEFKKTVLPKFLTENQVTDAHLSRMIAYSLLRVSSLEKEKMEYLYQLTWSIGWALRSYKRYIEASDGELATGEDVSLENYDDLITINHQTSIAASDLIFEEARKLESIKDFSELVLDRKDDDTYKRNLSQFYRTIKETVDIDFELNYLQKIDESKTKISSDAERQVKTWLKVVSPVTALLIAAVHYDLARNVFKNEEDAYDEMFDEIRKRSNFKSDSNFADSLKEGLYDIKNSVGSLINPSKIKDTSSILIITIK